MNLFTITKQSRKAVARRFVLLFLTFIAFGFTAKAQIPTFDEILKKYYDTDNIVLKASAERATPYGNQLPNYEFENWEKQTKKKLFSTVTFYEPNNWNSFMTAGGLLSSSVDDQLKESSEKRPGSSGSKSAHIFSSSIIGVVTNGNLTTGKINAGSTSVTGSSNYNATVRGEAKFNAPISSVPDSLTVWVAFRAKNSSSYASVMTAVHGDVDLRQLASGGYSDESMVCAQIAMDDAKYPRTCATGETLVWKRMSFPFTKGPHATPKYILTSFSTNVTPGGGDKGDEVFIDDACLIYNPTLNLGSLAQTEYKYSANGATMNINVPFALSGSMSVYNLNKADNEVIAQLSDANGSFSNPIELGRVTTNVSGTISGVIPANLTAGTGYKVRVISTNYPMTSNATNITISYPYVANPQIEIALGNVATKSASVTFTPNADCTKYYYMIALSTETVDAAKVKANGELKSGSFTKTWSNLISNTSYKVYALPLDADNNMGSLKSVTVKTQAFVPQIEIALGNVATKSASVTFTPNADCAQYYFLLSNATETVDVAKVKANGTVKTGTYTHTWENLISNTDYVIYALPLDADNNMGSLKSVAVKTQAFVPQVEIKDVNAGTKSASVTFTPNADCAQYYFLLSNATETVDAAKVKANGTVKTGTYTHTWENLISNTDYVIYALPLDADNNMGSLKSVTVKTQAFVPQVEIKDVNAGTKSASVTFTPNADCAQYYFLLSNATETVDAAKVKADGTVKTGTYTHTWENLISNTDYVIYALPLDADNNMGSLKSVTVKTQAFVPQVDVVRGNVGNKSIAVTFTPNADCTKYYYMIALASEMGQYQLEDIVEMVMEQGLEKTESCAELWEGLISNTDYVIYVLPFDIDGNMGEVKNVTIKTKAFVPQIEITDVNAEFQSVTATFTPNTDCAKYYYMIATASEMAEYQASEIALAEVVLANGSVKTELHTELWEGLVSNTAYVVCALPVDVDGNNGEIKTVNITTQAFAPQVDMLRGNVEAKSVSVTFIPNADCVKYYYMIATASEMAEYQLSGLSLKEIVMAEGDEQTASYATTFEGLTSNTAYVICALPVDVDGFYGEVNTINVTTNALVPQVEITDVNAGTKSVTATFTPNADCVQYYFVIALATETVDAAYIKNGENQTASYTTTFDEGLISNTDYVIYALPVDVEGNEGAVKTFALKTQAFVPQVEITRDSYTAKTITATFAPNTDCVEYYFVIAPATETLDAAYIKENGEKQTSTHTTTFEGLTSNTAYVIYALPVDVDGFNGEIKSIAVTTKALVPHVEITKGDVLTYSISASFTPNADCAQYYFYISTEIVDAEYIMTNGELKSEPYAHTWENLLPNTNYTIYVLPIDIEGNTGTVNTLAVKTRVEAGVSEIDIDIEKLSETSVTITAKPNENTVLYHYIVVTKAEADAMGEDALMEMLNENENYLTVADVYTMTVESNVAYCVIAQGKNADDKWGEVTRYEFVVAGPAAVAIAVEKLSETSVTVTATPNENTASYQYIVIEKAEADAMDEATLMQKLEEANDHNIVDVWTYKVESNVEYYVIAQGKNADGMLGELTKVEFVVAGPATVAIAVEKLSETSVTVTATPNENAVSYHYIVVTKAEAEAMGEEALMQMLNENENYIEGVNVAEVTVESNVEYYVIAQAKNVDGKWGTVTKVEFVVNVAGASVVAIEIEKLSETSVTVTATPNENTVSYQYIVIEKAEADAMSEDALMQKLAEANKLTKVDVWTYKVESNVEYYVIAQGKNADDKSGEITKVEFVVAGPATVAIAVEKLSETSVIVTATPNENAVSYHYIVIAKAEADAMGEDALMQMLDENEDYLEGVNVAEVIVESNVEYYVVAQAKNADGKWGTMTKQEFIVKVAGTSVVAIDVEELSKTLVSITATPNENTVLYHYIVIEKAEAEQMGEDAVMQKLAENEDYLEGVDMWNWTIKSDVYYYVIAQGKNADGVWGDVTKVEFFVESGVAVAELESVLFEIYPNPSSEYVRITSAQEIENLTIFSMDGKMVYYQDVNQQETMVNVTGFAKGSYIVRMISNGRAFIEKIIVR